MQTFNFWEIVFDGIQICLGSFILFFLIRNRIKYKQLVPKTPHEQNSPDLNTAFIIQAIRQQSELAFTNISQTIDKERQILNTCFELKETPTAPKFLKPSLDRDNNQVLTPEHMQTDSAELVYGEIENLAAQRMSIEEISQKLDVPQGEVELVLKLKRLRVESAKNKNNPQR